MTAQKDAAKLLTAIRLLNYYLHMPAASVGNNGRINMVTIIIWAIALTPLAIPVSNWWCNRGLRR